MERKTEVDLDRKASTLIVRLRGPVEGYRTSWQETIDDYLEKAGGDFVLNLTEANFIDSRGMGYIFALHKSLHASGRRLLLVVTPSGVRDSFEAAGVTELLRLYESEELALDDE